MDITLSDFYTSRKLSMYIVTPKKMMSVLPDSNKKM